MCCVHVVYPRIDNINFVYKSAQCTSVVYCERFLSIYKKVLHINKGLCCTVLLGQVVLYSYYGNRHTVGCHSNYTTRLGKEQHWQCCSFPMATGCVARFLWQRAVLPLLRQWASWTCGCFLCGHRWRTKATIPVLLECSRPTIVASNSKRNHQKRRKKKVGTFKICPFDWIWFLFQKHTTTRYNILYKLENI